MLKQTLRSAYNRYSPYIYDNVFFLMCWRTNKHRKKKKAIKAWKKPRMYCEIICGLEVIKRDVAIQGYKSPLLHICKELWVCVFLSLYFQISKK